MLCHTKHIQSLRCLVYAQIRPPPDEQHLPLSFDFPEGSLVGIAKERLPVNVSFTGSRPTSFTANVVFLDEDGKRFSLPITGTTDASLLTIKSFLDVRTHPLTLVPARTRFPCDKCGSFQAEFVESRHHVTSGLLRIEDVCISRA